jgi:hypothetical protein
MTLEAVESPKGFQIKVAFQAADREDPNETHGFKINSQREFPLDANDTTIWRAARNTAGVALLHELDEFFVVDSKRIYDPHRNTTICFCYESPCEHLR